MFFSHLQSTPLQHKLRQKLRGLLMVWICSLMSGFMVNVSRSANIYISSQEAKENNLTGQQVADSLDDYWISWFDPLVDSSTHTYLSSPFLITGNVGTSTVLLTYPQINAPSIPVYISLMNVTWSDPRGQLNTTSFATISDASTLQDTSPKPLSLANTLFWNEESAWSTTSKNGILFNFDQPIWWFGVWIGDVESRTDGTWVAAEIRLFDSQWNLITSTIIQPTIANQSLCGWSTSTSSPSECGNETTRFVWFTDSTQSVASMLIVVWDDDPGDDGFREHLSFVWPTIATKIIPWVCGISWSFGTGDLPSDTNTLCSSGILSGHLQWTWWWSWSCMSINSNSVSSCSLSILPPESSTNTGIDSSSWTIGSWTTTSGEVVTWTSSWTISTWTTTWVDTSTGVSSWTGANNTGEIVTTWTISMSWSEILWQNGSWTTGESTTSWTHTGDTNTGGTAVSWTTSENSVGQTNTGANTGTTTTSINTGGTTSSWGGSWVSFTIIMPVYRVPQWSAYIQIPLPIAPYRMNTWSVSSSSQSSTQKKPWLDSLFEIKEVIETIIMPVSLPDTWVTLIRKIWKKVLGRINWKRGIIQ